MKKAYHVTEVNGDYATIIFAESRNEAKKLALATDCCEDAQYIDIRVHREPIADPLYDGEHWEIDWYNMETRRFLMQELNWSCSDVSFECDSCPCKQFCNWWEDEQDERIEM